MFSKRSLEGYLMIDHRAGAGIDVGTARAAGRDTIPVRGLFETSILTCSHCQQQVILNPDRSRERGFCPKCDRYVCDGCEAIRVASGGACKTWKQIMDEHVEAVIQAEQRLK